MAEGRRIPKEKSVEDPTLAEIMETLKATGINALPEYKQYSREKSKEMSFRGRVKVQIKNDDGTPCNPEFPTSKSFYEKRNFNREMITLLFAILAIP